MSKKKIYVVLNGKAGRRTPEQSQNIILEGFRKTDPETEVEFGFTQRAMHAAELARDAAKSGKYYAVVAAGGDGTVNEVCNGMAHSGGVMGIIPNGSTNVFCKEVMISSVVDEACKIILEGVPTVVDVGYLPEKERYFIWMCGVGIEAKIANEVMQVPKLKKYLGVLAYVLIALKQLKDIGFQIMKLSFNDVEMTYSTFNTVIGNATSFDGFLGVRSKYGIRDGFLDTCVIQKWSVMGILHIIFNFMKGRRDYYRFIDKFSVAHCRVKKMRVETVPNAWYHVDGEVMGQTPFDVEIHEGAVTLILPKDYAGEKAAKDWAEKSAAARA